MLPFSPVDDLLLFDGIAPVQWTAADGTVTEVPALRRGGKCVQAAHGDGGPPRCEATWYVASPATASSQRPRPGDTWTEADGTVWTIAEVALGLFEARWRVVARRVDWDAAASELITMERALVSQDAQGAVQRTWHAVASGQVALIVPRIDTIDNRHQSRGRMASYSIYLKEAWTPERDDRAVRTTGEVLTIVEVHPSPRADEPNRLLAERSDWPTV